MKKLITIVLIVFSGIALAGPKKKQCRQDFKKLCEDQKFTKRNIKLCLIAKKDELSEGCKEYVEKFSGETAKIKKQKMLDRKAAAASRVTGKKKALTDKAKGYGFE